MLANSCCLPIALILLSSLLFSSISPVHSASEPISTEENATVTLNVTSPLSDPRVRGIGSLTLLYPPQAGLYGGWLEVPSGCTTFYSGVPGSVSTSTPCDILNVIFNGSSIVVWSGPPDTLDLSSITITLDGADDSELTVGERGTGGTTLVYTANTTEGKEHNLIISTNLCVSPEGAPVFSISHVEIARGKSKATTTTTSSVIGSSTSPVKSAIDSSSTAYTSTASFSKSIATSENAANTTTTTFIIGSSTSPVKTTTVLNLTTYTASFSTHSSSATGSHSSGSGKSNHAGALAAGVVVGGFALLALLAATVILLRRHRARESQKYINAAPAPFILADAESQCASRVHSSLSHEKRSTLPLHATRLAEIASVPTTLLNVLPEELDEFPVRNTLSPFSSPFDDSLHTAPESHIFESVNAQAGDQETQRASSSHTPLHPAVVSQTSMDPIDALSPQAIRTQFEILWREIHRLRAQQGEQTLRDIQLLESEIAALQELPPGYKSETATTRSREETDGA